MKTQKKLNTIAGLTFITFAALPINAEGASISLGSAINFAVLGATTVTNTGLSTITGDLGISPNAGTSITGFPPGIVIGTVHGNNSIAIQAQLDASSAYDQLGAAVVTQNLTDQSLGGRTLTPGVYSFESSAMLIGTLTLDSGNDPAALFIFQIDTTFTTGSDAKVMGINGTDASQVFFQVGSSATLGTGSRFLGTIIARESNTLNTGATVEGRVISLNGAVTMDSNIIAIPEPSVFFLCLGAAFMSISRRNRVLSV